MLTNTDAPPDVLKRGWLRVELGKPIEFGEADTPAATSTVRGHDGSLIGSAMRAYQTSARELIAGQYRALAGHAPAHLAQPCNITVFICNDGTIVRFDASADGQVDTRVRVVPIDKTLSEWSPLVTDNVVHFPPESSEYTPEPCGPAIVLEHHNYASRECRVLEASVPMLFARATFPEGAKVAAPPRKPTALVSLTNELEFTVDGHVLEPESGHATRVRRATDIKVRQIARLSVGWLAIEIFPRLDETYWRPEYAAGWAEADLLQYVAQRQLANSKLAALDPHAAARKSIDALLHEFELLLEGPEEPAHQFIKQHPQLLSLTHVECWSKLPFGEWFSDFVLREPDGRYVLVELESPQHLLFRKDGHPRQALNHAIGQIADWRSHLEQNLDDVRNRLGLRDISSNPDALIVIGRSSCLSAQNRTKLTTLQNQMPKLRIMTYEDLIGHTRAMAANLFGAVGLETTGEVFCMPSRRA